MKYSDYMSAITPDSLFEGLLSSGMMGDRLPPVLQSKSFYQYVLENGISSLGKSTPNVCCTYLAAKHDGGTRRFSIPTPASYARLCACLRDNWPNLQAYFAEATASWPHKVSRIHLRKGSKRGDPACLFHMNYHNWKTDPDPEMSLLFGSGLRVHADVSTCFPSVYTHAVPWVLMGKAEAKKKRDSKQHWSNEIDRCLRNMMGGETHGIPIGPHASNLVSEIILVAVDWELNKCGWRYVRNIDDYACYVKDEYEAGAFLKNLESALAGYGFSLNSQKTRVEPLPEALAEEWPSRLRRFPLGEGKIGYPTMRAFFEYAVELATESGDQAVYTYMLRMLAGRELTVPAHAYLEQIASHLLLRYSYLLPIAEELLFEGHEFSIDRIAQIADALMERSNERQDSYAGYFALYYAMRYSLQLPSFSVDPVIGGDDCLLKLFALRYAEQNSLVGELGAIKDDARVLSRQDKVELDQNWPFIYEALGADELPGDWRHMKRLGVTFWRV